MLLNIKVSYVNLGILFLLVFMFDWFVLMPFVRVDGRGGELLEAHVTRDLGRMRQPLVLGQTAFITGRVATEITRVLDAHVFILATGVYYI